VDKGQEVLGHAQTAFKKGVPYHLVLLDRRLADTDAFQIAETLKQTQGFSEIAVMILTGDNWADDIARTYDLGLDGYLVKPFRRPDLQQAISIAIRKSKGKKPPSPEKQRDEDHPMGIESKILVAEDSPDNRLLLNYYLNGSPYHIDVVEHGGEAIEKFQAAEYDLVLMDMHMPVMDGYTATQTIRQWEKEQGRSPTPIIAITANALKEEESRSLTAGCTAHLTKPIKKSTLLEAIKTHIRKIPS